jgi:hypothetical protein
MSLFTYLHSLADFLRIASMKNDVEHVNGLYQMVSYASDLSTILISTSIEFKLFTWLILSYFVYCCAFS